MWKGGDDHNDKGETVRLYHAILYGRKPDPTTRDAVSFIGGCPAQAPLSSSSSSSSSSSPAAPTCASCQAPLYLLLQLLVPAAAAEAANGGFDRTFQVFACNRAACLNQLFASSINNSTTGTASSPSNVVGGPLCHGGGGVVVCYCRRRKEVKVINQEPTTTTTVEAAAAWTEDALVMEDNAQDSEDNDDEWGTDATLDIKEMEAKLAAIETTTAESKKKQLKESSSMETQESAGSGNSFSFSCFELRSLQEPPATTSAMMMMMDDDDDDVGMERTNPKYSDDKIQQMLARYMAEEQDQDILTALQQQQSTACGGGHGGGGGGGGRGAGGERDERLSPQDRVLLTYSDRLKRFPRQVVRHAPGGIPMWSIPTIAPTNNNDNKQTFQKKPKAKSKSNQAAAAVIEQPIPHCDCCGSARVFEAQLLPSLLHVLDVDKYAPTPTQQPYNNKNNDNNNTTVVGPIQQLDALYSQGGMNWGNIAIYSCSNPACSGGGDALREEYVVVQGSVEGQPTTNSSGPLYSYEPVVIAEGASFNDDEDDNDDVDSEEESDDELLEEKE